LKAKSKWILSALSALLLAGGAATAVWLKFFRQVSYVAHYELNSRRSLPADCPAADITAVTYNAAIAPGMVWHTAPRKPRVIEALKAFRQADILCIQEVWKAEDAKELIEALELPPEQVFWEDTSGRNEAPGVYVCPPGTVSEKLAPCFEERCRGRVAPEDEGKCVQSRCGDIGLAMMNLSQKHRRCLNCLIALTGKPADEIIRTCEGPVGASRIQGGGNGVILASRRPLKNRQVLHLESSGANRVALFSTISIPGKGEVEAACTHISSPQNIPPMHTGFRTWELEQRAQIRAISVMLDMRGGGQKPQILIGDMNAGPKIAGTGIAANQDRVYRSLMDEGFFSPAIDAAEPFCASCEDNTLRRGGRNHLIDHVMTRGTGLSPACASRVLDQPVIIEKWKGEKELSSLSDHYGVMVKFDFRR